MADTELQFRTATFGGFQKQDVLLYIETMTREHREKLDGLQLCFSPPQAALQSWENDVSHSPAETPVSAALLFMPPHAA